MYVYRHKLNAPNDDSVCSPHRQRNPRYPRERSHPPQKDNNKAELSEDGGRPPDRTTFPTQNNRLLLHDLSFSSPWTKLTLASVLKNRMTRIVKSSKRSTIKDADRQWTSVDTIRGKCARSLTAQQARPKQTQKIKDSPDGQGPRSERWPEIRDFYNSVSIQILLF